MDVRQLRYFVRIVETKSFTKAAEQLRVAQPALGSQIRKLEDELGISLLIRHSRGVQPTDAGLIMLEHACDILQRVDATVQCLKDMSAVPQGRIVLGMTPSVSSMLAARLVLRSAEMLPEVSLNLVEELSSVLTEWVEAEQLEMTFAYKIKHTAGLIFEPLVEEEVYFITNAESPGARRGPITLKELARHSLIMPGVPHGLRQLLEEQAKRLGITLKVSFEMRSVSTTRELVEQRVGSTVLPFGAVRRQVEEGKLIARPIRNPRIARVLYLVYSNRRLPTKAELALRALITELINEEIRRSEGIWRLPAEVGDQSADI